MRLLITLVLLSLILPVTVHGLLRASQHDSVEKAQLGERQLSYSETPCPMGDTRTFLPCELCDGECHQIESDHVVAQYDGKYYLCQGSPFYKVTKKPLHTKTNGGGCDCQCYGKEDCHCKCNYDDDDSNGNEMIHYDITYGPGYSGNPCQCSCADDGNNGYSCSCDCQEGGSSGGSMDYNDDYYKHKKNGGGRGKHQKANAKGYGQSKGSGKSSYSSTSGW